MLRLTGSERAVAEIVAVAEHVASLTAVVAAFQLASDVPSDPGERPEALLPLVQEDSAGDAASTLHEIREWSRQHLGVDRAPAIWRALAHQPRVLDSTWRKDRLVLSAGAADEFVKACAALAVAQFRQSPYWISYFTQLLRTQHGLDSRGLVDVASVVMHFVSFNTIAHGMRLDAPVADIAASDVAAGGPLEHVVPGGRRRVVSDER